ncbi:DUF3800 domain-containing protein [Methanomassiliicoccus luminyensis]|uniref:DUF3800 domain-containing protein n=1 Tax=Methanomassiliicoccus luminyensis TaxID=1080712 RepID=UPI0003793A8D|nr:DUF3800 domain-containing protein [Methanomassiliicoccus luminyensis]
MDESGDLGSSPNSSRHFVVAAMAVPGSINFDRLTKNARKKLGKKEGMGELKFNRSLDLTKRFILEGVAQSDCQIAWASYEKSRLPSALLTDKHKMYMMACESVFPELFRRVLARRVHIVMDRYFSKRWECDILNEHVGSLLNEYHTGNFIPKFQVSQLNSESRKELQVHDFVVGAIFQHVERGVDKYIDIIKNNIVYSRSL